jgi:tRNA pseudouridine55 synthase
VRALARDLGERLGTGAHLVALRRTRSGAFDLARAVSGVDFAGARERLIPLSGLLLELPEVRVGAEGRRLVGHGRALAVEHLLSDLPAAGVARVRVLDEGGELLALAVPQFGEPEDSPLPRPAGLRPDLVLIG